MSSTEGLGLQEGSSNVDKRLGDLSKASLELQHCSTRRVRVRSRDRRVVIAIVAAYLVALWIFLSIFKPTERRVTNGGTGSMEIWQNLLGWIPRLGKSSATPGLVANPRSLLSAEDLTHINRLHWLSLGMFASLGVVQTVTTYVDADSSTREMNIVTTGLSLIGCICYLTLATSSGPMFHSSAPGRFIYPTRLLTWLFSTSLLHYATWVYGEKPLSYLWRTLGFNATMLMAGVVCSLCTGWLMWAGFLVSASSFLLMGCCKYQMFGMEDIEETKRASHAISRLKFVIGAIWCVFPAAWILQFSPLSSVAIEAIVIMADVASKAVMLAMQKAALMLASDRRHVTMMQLSLELIKDMQEQEKRKEGFFTAMTNELRTPMKSIVDMLESVLQQKASLSDKVLSTITNVRDAGQRFSLLISTILDASSVKASRLRLQPKPVNIRKIIDDVAVLIEPLMCSNTKLEIQVSRNLPAVDADPIRLSQVLFNILGNAAKFTPSGKITVAARIDLGGIMRIKVKDTGRSPNPTLSIL